MAFDFIQGTSADVASTTSTTLTFPGAVTPGSTLLISVRAGANAADTMTVCSDNVNGTYTEIHAPVLNATSSRLYNRRFYNTAAGTPQCTITFSAATTIRWSISEWGEVDTTAGLDQVVTGDDTTTATTITAGPITTTAADSILIAVFGPAGSAADSNPGTETAGYTRRFGIASPATFIKYVLSSQVLAATGTHSDVLTFSNGVSDFGPWAIFNLKKQAAAADTLGAQACL